MRATLFALLGLLAVAPALAADEKSSGEGPAGTNVDMPVVIVPMTQNDKLTGYAYVQSRLAAATPTDAIAVRDKIAFVLDAFVRDANGAPLEMAGDPPQVDKAAIGARLLADARRIMGAAHVKAIVVTDVQIAPLHPVMTQAPSVPATPEPAPAAPAKPH